MSLFFRGIARWAGHHRCDATSDKGEEVKKKWELRKLNGGRLSDSILKRPEVQRPRLAGLCRGSDVYWWL
jgi:hypothetical protein